jgi:hypothetical protein
MHMSNNQAGTGKHLSKGQGDSWAVVSDVPERQGVTGHNVRFVLIGGLAGAVLALAIVYLIYFH